MSKVRAVIRLWHQNNRSFPRRSIPSQYCAITGCTLRIIHTHAAQTCTALGAVSPLYPDPHLSSQSLPLRRPSTPQIARRQADNLIAFRFFPLHHSTCSRESRVYDSRASLSHLPDRPSTTPYFINIIHPARSAPSSYHPVYYTLHLPPLDDLADVIGRWAFLVLILLCS